MRLNLDNICNKIEPIVDTKISDFRIVAKTWTPAILGALVIQSASEYLKSIPSESLPSLVFTSLKYSTWGALAIGVFCFYKSMDAKHNILKGREIQYLKISQNDFNAMQDEILRLRKELENSNTK